MASNSEAGFLLKAFAGAVFLVAGGEAVAAAIHTINVVEDNATKISNLGQGDQAALATRISNDSRDAQNSFGTAIEAGVAGIVVFAAGKVISGSSNPHDRRVTRI